MNRIIVSLDGEERVFIDAIGSAVQGEAVPAGSPKMVSIEEVGDRLQSALGVLKSTGRSVGEMFREMEASEVSLKLGLGFTADGQILIAKAGSAVNFEVTFLWKRPDESRA